MTIKVILVDDHRILREGIKNILEDTSDIQVLAEADNGRDAVRLARELHPDIIIMDIAMSELNGIEATKMITRDDPGIRVIALSMHADKHYISGIFQAGASGYLLKHSAAKELIEAIRTIYANHTYLSKEISDVVVREFSKKFDEISEQASSLSTREKEVLQLVSEGKSTRVIAEILFVSVKTVEAHRQKIMYKLNLFTVPELTKYAIKTGLTTLDE